MVKGLQLFRPLLGTARNQSWSTEDRGRIWGNMSMGMLSEFLLWLGRARGMGMLGIPKGAVVGPAETFSPRFRQGKQDLGDSEA